MKKYLQALRSNRITAVVIALALANGWACKPPPESLSNNRRSHSSDTTTEGSIGNADKDTSLPAPLEAETMSDSSNSINEEPSSLAEQHPLLEHLTGQQKTLLELSEEPGKEIEPDGKYLNQKFASGRITLVLDEIDGEPAYFYGRIPGAGEDEGMEFLIYQYSNDELEQFVPGKPYHLDWMETIALMEPFDHGYHHCFIAYQIVPAD